MLLRKGSMLAWVFVLITLGCAGTVNAVVLIDIDWQDQTVGTLLNTIPGWTPIPGSSNNPVIATHSSEPANNFLTTGTENNQATRDAFVFTNPGFFSGTTLTFTVDMLDPLVNQQSALSTFPRIQMGIFDLGGGASLPSYFGMNHDDLDPNGDPTTAEWAIAGEDFGTPGEAPEMFSAEGSIAPDTWYTVRSVWNFGANTKSLEYKLRDSADPFTPVFSDEIGFLDPDEDLASLDALAIRLNRGTRVDNILVEYDVVQAPGQDGDYNDDDTVDAADYAAWRKFVGADEGTLPNDPDADGGTIGEPQYLTWVANFSEPAAGGGGSGGNVAPEPSGIVLGLLCILAAACARSRKAPLSRGVEVVELVYSDVNDSCV
jgi:hypothetical protein